MFQHVPRAVSVAPPFDVMFAPTVAVVLAMFIAVGEVRVGAAATIVIVVDAVSVLPPLVPLVVNDEIYAVIVPVEALPDTST